MFLYRNGRLCFGSASFVLPDDCFVDTSLPVDSHNGFVIQPIDQSFKINLDFDVRGLEPCCGLKGQAENWSGDVEIREETLPCGIGWSAILSFENRCYRELCIPMREGVTDEYGNTLNEMSVQIVAGSVEEAVAATRHRVFLELVNSIVV